MPICSNTAIATFVLAYMRKYKPIIRVHLKTKLLHQLSVFGFGNPKEMFNNAGYGLFGTFEDLSLDEIKASLIAFL